MYVCTYIRGCPIDQSNRTKREVLVKQQKTAPSPFTSLAYLKLWISEKFKAAKEEWHDTTAAKRFPAAAQEVLFGPSQERGRPDSRLDTHWTLEVGCLPEENKKRRDNKCWFCRGRNRMTRSHVFLHCPYARIRAAREEA
jgi:hypothetical protein